MGHTQTGASLHAHHRLNRHGQVDDGTVTLAVTERLQRIGKFAHALVKLAIGDLGHVTSIRLKNQRDFFSIAIGEMHIQTVGRYIELAITEPFVERRIRLVQHLRERLVPVEFFARQATPESVWITVCLLEQGLISGHPGNVGLPGKRLRGWKNTSFNQYGLNG